MGSMDVTRAGTPFAVARQVTFSREISEYCVLGGRSPFDFLLVHRSDWGDCFHVQGGRQKLAQLVKVCGISVENVVRIVPEKNKIYIFYCSQSKEWHRCRLLSFNKDDDSGIIFFFDYYLEVYVVSLNELREVPPGLMQAYPVVVPIYRCHLHDVIPVDGSHIWSKVAIDWFIYHLGKRTFWKAMQMVWRKRRAPGGGEGSDFIIDLGVVLFENSNNDAWMDRLGSLNWKLVLRRQGKAIGAGGSYFSSLFFNDGEPMFSLFGMPEMSLPTWVNIPVPQFGSNRLGQFIFKYLAGPDCFYVTLVSKYKELKAMHHFINQNLEKLDVAADDIRPGFPVLVEYDQLMKIEQPKHTPLPRIRGVVLQGAGSGCMVKVCLVDFGIVVRVNINQLSQIPERLVLIPSFSHRIHLNSIRPLDPLKAPITSWSFLANPGSRRHFNFAIKEIDESDSKPAFFAIRENPKDDIIRLDEIGQPLMFDVEYNRWTPRKRLSSINIEQRPLIENLFYSFGVDIVFLRRTAPDAPVRPWKFESLAEIFLENPAKFRAGPIPGKLMDKKVYYRTLLKLKDEEYV